jgi:hypothetical protein
MDGKPPTKRVMKNVVMALFGQVKNIYMYEKCAL